MSADLNKRIDDARAKVAEIQFQIGLVVEWANKISMPLFHPPPANRQDLVEQYERFHFLSGRLNVAQQDLSSLLLESLGESSKKLQELTGQLDSDVRVQVQATKELAAISKEQSETTKRLESSSVRVEHLTASIIALTYYVMLFAAALLVVTIYIDNFAWYSVTIGVVAVFALIVLGPRYLRKTIESAGREQLT